MAPPDALRCYAVRRLNPFLGVTQVVECGDARAISTDGRNWELQWRVERRTGWGRLNLGQVETVYCRLGLWSTAEGLAKIALPPHVDRITADQRCGQLVEAIEASLAAIPFALADRRECWLLDATTGKPCALLASQVPAHAPLVQPPRRWQGGSALAAEIDWSPLTAWLVRLCLPAPAWIERDEAGEGQLAGEGRRLASADFPELLLIPPAAALERETALYACYLEQRAPRLLMLPMAESTRSALEALSCRQPAETVRFCGLYPAIADPARLTALRVQVRLTTAAD